MGITCSSNLWKKEEWRKVYKNELNNMWQSRKNQHIQYSLKKDHYCHLCNDEFILICQCAKKKYIDSITYDQLQNFLKRNRNVEALVLVKEKVKC